MILLLGPGHREVDGISMAPAFLMLPEIYERMVRKIMGEHKAGDVWNWLCSARESDAKAIARTNDEDKVCDILVKIKSQYEEQSDGQRKRKEAEAARKGKGNGKSKGKDKSRPQAPVNNRKGPDARATSVNRASGATPESQYVVPNLRAFMKVDGTAIELITADDYNSDSTGMLIGSIAEHAKGLLERQGEHANKALALLLFGNVKQIINDPLKSFHLFSTVEIKVPIAKKKGGPIRELEAILVNIGATEIIFNPQIAKVTMPEAPYVTLSYRLIKSQNDAKVFEGTAKDPAFISHVTTTLKHEWLSPLQKPHATFSREVTIEGVVTKEQWGFIHVKKDKSRGSL